MKLLKTLLVLVLVSSAFLVHAECCDGMQYDDSTQAADQGCIGDDGTCDV